jgi:hypothetical protein
MDRAMAIDGLFSASGDFQARCADVSAVTPGYAGSTLDTIQGLATLQVFGQEPAVSAQRLSCEDSVRIA